MALTDNLVTYYKFDGNSNDSVGTNNGTDTAITYSTNDGKINTGAGFNGSTSKILQGSNNGAYTDFTFSCWVKGGAVNLVILRESAGGTGWTPAIMTDASGHITAGIVNYGVGPSSFITGGTVVTGGAWFHVVYTKNAAGKQNLYINGVSDATEVSGTVATMSTIPYAIGCEYYAGTGYSFWSGSIDEFACWSRALSANEAQALYRAGQGNQFPFGSAFNNTLTPSVRASSGLSVTERTM